MSAEYATINRLYKEKRKNTLKEKIWIRNIVQSHKTKETRINNLEPK
jgi:hypothetical protein